MQNNTGETKSYKDPQGERVFMAAKERKERDERFGMVGELYDGFYASFIPDGKPGYAYVGGAEGIIGTAISHATASGECLQDAAFAKDTAAIILNNAVGETIAALDAQTGERILLRINDGWQIEIFLSLVVYNKVDKRFTGELACICYDKKLGDPFVNFVKNINFRIRKGDHPGLELTQDQFVRVLESNGAWYLTKAVPLPKRDSNEMVYKRRRQWSEGLVEAAVRGNLGCKIAGIAFWVVIAAVFAVLIWWFFIH